MGHTGQNHVGLGGIRLALGGNVFGWTIDREQSFRVLDAYFEAGGRMIDSADVYSSWVPGNVGGESEAIIGAWVESRGVRGEVRIATKTGMHGDLRPEKVMKALDGSLERLRTDYVDLFYIHRDDPVTPLDDVVAGFGATVAGGKVRELGASNFGAERFAASLESARRQGVAAYSVLQPGYNLVWRREYEPALEAIAVAQGVAVLPYYALGAGFLTGKYRSEADFTGARGGSAQQFAENGWKALPVLEAVAGEVGASMSAVALAWLNTRPAVWAPIASGTSVEQVRGLCAAASLALSEDQVARLTAVSIDG